MNRFIIMTLVLVFCVSFSFLFAEQPTTALQEAENVEELSGSSSVNLLEGFSPVKLNHFNLLYDNGPLINSLGTGVGGADESVVQSSLGLSTLGFGHQLLNNYRIADDFIITDPNGWNIDSLVFYAYQTGSPTTSTISAVNYKIWDGVPHAAGSNVVFGDSLTNRLINTRWSNIYRVSESTSGSSADRPIMANTVDAGVTLPPGVYWLDWQSDGSLPSGPWAPPITINGDTITGNALQSLSPTVWDTLRDSGSLTMQGLPFLVYGEMNSGSQDAPELMWYKFDEAGENWTYNYANPATAVNDSAEILGGLTMGNAGQYGTALVGSGNPSSTDYVNTFWATNLGTGSWTIEMWLNNVPNNTNLNYLFGDPDAGSFRCFIGGAAGAGNLILRGPIADVLVSGVAPGPNVVTFVYDETVPEVRAYVNGVLNNTVPQSAVNIVGAGPFKIGGYSTSAGMTAGMLMDEFKIYARAIDMPQTLPELMWYKFDEAGANWTENFANPITSVSDSAEVLGSLSMGGSGVSGSALIGSGNPSSTDYVNTFWATNLGTGSWTIEMWLNNVPNNTDLNYLFGDPDAGSFRCFIGGVAGAGNLILRGPIADVLVSGVAPGPNVVTLVYDETVPEVRAYVNGVLNNTVPQSGVNIVGAGPFKIGGYSTSAGMTAGMLMDEFMFYARVVDPATPPVINVDPNNIVRQVNLGDSTDVILTISNQGGSDLNWTANVATNLEYFLAGLHNQQPINIENYPRGNAPVSLGLAPKSTDTVERIVNESSQNLFLNNDLAYGYDAIGGQFIKFNLPSANNTTVISSLTEDLFSGDFGAGGVFYAVHNSASSLVTVDTMSGVLVTVGAMTIEPGHTWTGLTYDVSTGTMYAMSTNAITSTLYTVDTNTGATTVVGSTTTAPIIIDISVNNTGEMYAHDLGDNIYSIDKFTGAATLIGPTGFDANYAQGMDFDPNTGILYLAAYNNAIGSAELRTVDLLTGATTLLGPIGAGAGVEVCAFGISGSSAPPFIKLLPPTSGTVSPGGQVNLVARLYGIMPVLDDTTLTAEIEISSNDPSTPLFTVPVQLDILTDIEETKLLPTVFAVEQNFPNPFNPSTTIRFQVPRNAQVKLTVFNMLGQKVRTLLNEAMGPGYYDAVWDGRNDTGVNVSSGVYIYKFEAGNYTRVRKMMFLK